MAELVIDIETIPAQRLDVMQEINAGLKAELASKIAQIRPPGNYKKQESIDEWMSTEAPKIREALESEYQAAAEEAYRKTGLDGAFGQIAVVGVALDDAPPVTVYRTDWENETGILEDLGCLLTDLIPLKDAQSTMVIGHNVASFDLRFLTQRHIVRGIRPHRLLTRAAQAKPWESEKVFDTMVQWAGVGHRISLDKLCKALGIKSPKTELDGSKVWDYVRDGKIDEVARYCAEDVKATRAAYRRMIFRTQEVPAQYEFEDCAF